MSKNKYERRIGFRYQIANKLDMLIFSYLERKSKKWIKSGYPQVCSYSFDHIGSQIDLFGRYEKDLLDLAIDYIKGEHPDKIKLSAFDVGANIGNHTLFFSEFFSYVYSFEPVQKTFEMLKLNTDNVYNVSIQNIALSSERSLSFIESNPVNRGASSITNNQTGEKIRLETLDSIVEINEIDVGLIKIDVEGHEMQVLKGASKTLITQKPCVLLEVLESEINNNKNESIEFLKELGYEKFYEVGSTPDINSKFARIFYFIFGYKVGVRKLKKMKKKNYKKIIAIKE